MKDEAVSALLARSDEFETTLSELFPEQLSLADSTAKVRVAATACVLSIEHAFMTRTAFASGASNSGSALLRLQFEALVRSTWCLFAATALQLDKLDRELDHQTELGAKNVAGLTDMLDAVVRKAPPALSAPLQEFHEHSRHALNSYVHSGIHALRRAQDGFPVALAEQLIRMSNGLLHFAYRMLASLTGSQELMDVVTRKYKEFSDCLPINE